VAEVLFGRATPRARDAFRRTARPTRQRRSDGPGRTNEAAGPQRCPRHAGATHAARQGLVATIKVVAYDNGAWGINGDFCQDDLTAGRLVMQCLEALADTRTNDQGHWIAR
jgi:hypothetical protein